MRVGIRRALIGFCFLGGYETTQHLCTAVARESDGTSTPQKRDSSAAHPTLCDVGVCRIICGDLRTVHGWAQNL
jgi:hypothetical protein